MDVYDVKRWQWALAGLVAGLALAWSWLAVDPDYGLQMNAEALEQNLAARDFATGRPIVDNLTVYPVREGQDLQRVTYDLRVVRLRPGNAGSEDQPDARQDWLPRTSFIEVPYPGTGEGDFADRLRQLEAQGIAPDLEYRYAWERSPTAGFTLFAVAGVLLVGGVWPSLLSVMSGAGLGPVRKEKSEKSRPWRKSKPSKSEKPLKVDPSSDDELAAVNAAYAASTGAGNSDGEAAAATPSPAMASAPSRPVAPRPLVTNKPDPEPAHPAATAESDEPKSFVGQYYPVARPGGAKNEE